MVDKLKNKKLDDLEGIEPRIYARRWKILATMCMSLLLVSIGNSSLNQALPTLARELNLSNLQLTWIVDIYPLLFAGLLFTSSAVADRYGRKLVMQIGLAFFVGATLFAGFIANSGSQLIIARAIMGLAASMVMPVTLSIIENVFTRKERPRAIAIWSGVAGGGVALGSLATGFLLEHYSWHSVFLFSSIIGLLGFVLNQIFAPDSRDEKQTPIDWLSGLLSTTGLLGLVYGIIESPSNGLTSTGVMASLTVGVVALAIFAVRQLKLKHPMLDVRLFKFPEFSVAAISVLLAFFALMGIFFSVSQLFQLVMGYSPLKSSFAMLPIMMLMMITAPVIPSVVKKIGVRITIATGLMLLAVSFLIMSKWPTQPEYWHIFGSMFVMMAGMSMTMTPSTNMMMSAVPRNRAGMGSAMNDTTRELGGALGIAVLGAVLGSVYSDKMQQVLVYLPEQARAVASGSLAGAMAAAEHSGAQGQQLAEFAKQAWMSGLSRAMIIASIIVALASLMSFIWLPKHANTNTDDEQLQPKIKG
ncbi:MFS transporter [Candidatus Saccharibacteria bacterium]|nr:MFS transporter [Candidatus Saccharibacteria bacterium]